MPHILDVAYIYIYMPHPRLKTLGIFHMFWPIFFRKTLAIFRMFRLVFLKKLAASGGQKIWLLVKNHVLVRQMQTKIPPLFRPITGSLLLSKTSIKTLPLLCSTVRYFAKIRWSLLPKHVLHSAPRCENCRQQDSERIPSLAHPNSKELWRCQNRRGSLVNRNRRWRKATMRVIFESYTY